MKSKFMLIPMLIITLFLSTSCMRQTQTGNKVLKDAKELEKLVNIKVEEFEVEKELEDYSDYSDDLSQLITSKISTEDTLEKVKIDNNNLYAAINLRQNDKISNEDIAVDRYNSITTGLLNNMYEWENIEIEFIEVGTIKMNAKDAKYFEEDGENRFIYSKITSNFKK